MGLIEKEGYKISYETGGTWIITTPEGENIKFKRGTRAYYVMPYIDMSKNMEAGSMLQTDRINYEGYTKENLRLISWCTRYRLDLAIHRTLSLKIWCVTNYWKISPLNLSTSPRQIIYLAQPLQDLGKNL